MPDGVYRARTQHDGFEEPILINCTVTVKGDRIAIDYAGSSPQVPRAVNVVPIYCFAYSAFAVKALLCPDVPNNEGSFLPITTSAPLGSIFNPRYPAASGGRGMIGHMMVPAIIMALAEVLQWMVEDGLVAAETADDLKNERRLHGGKIHPLIVIADQKWRSLQPPGKLLALEALTEWLAGRTGLDYLHIDPLKIDFTGVAEVMSSAYAARFGILPVQVTTREVVIATAEPYGAMRWRFARG